MDVLYPNYIQHQVDSRHPELENYSELIKQLSQPTDLPNGLPPNRTFALNTPPRVAATSGEGLRKGSSSSSHRHSSSQSTPQTNQHSRVGIMDRRFSQHTQPPSFFLPDMQDDEDALNMAFSNMAQQSASVFGPSLEAAYGPAMSQQNEFDSEHPIWRGGVNEVASYPINDTQRIASMLGTASNMQGNAGFDLASFSGADIVSRPAVDHHTEASALVDAERLMMSDQRNDPFGPSDQAIIQQPTAMHGSSLNPSNRMSQLNAEAERMGQSSPQYTADAGLRFSHSESSPEDMQQTFSQNSHEQSTQSPHSIAEEQEMAMLQSSGQDSRRPSGATELAQNIQNVHLHHSQSNEDFPSYGGFKRPSIPLGGSSTLAARRKQQVPSGITVSRYPMSRTVSSSAIAQVNGAARATTTSTGTLRRNKSSNVVLNGRVVKSGNNSARNSPMLASFSESAAMSAQATPQPGNPMMQSSATLAPPSPRHQTHETHFEMPPSSASTGVFTPGIYSGGSMGHSFQNTPSTTPLGFNQPPQFRATDWMPASDVPQSAPAHMTTFPRDVSPSHGVMPSMPPTPANMHFSHPSQHTPYSMQMPVQMNHGPMVHSQMPVVPSQHGVPEGFAFASMHDQEMMQFAHQHPMFSEPRDDFYMPNNPFLAHWAFATQTSKAMDFKLDAGVDKLNEEVRKGRASLLPVTKTEFTFNNLYSSDMKKQQDKS